MTSQLNAQSTSNQLDIRAEIEGYVQDLIENQEDANVSDYNTLIEDVERLLLRPIDINTATAEELGDIPVLTGSDVSAIVRHRATYGDLIDIYELQSIDGLSIEKARILRHLVYVKGGRSLRSGDLIYTSNSIYLKTRYQAQKARGFKERNGVTAFRGSRPYLYARWRRDTPDRWSMGLTVEKDAGEQLIKDGVNLDYYSLFVQKQNVNTTIKNIILGDYHLSIGHGLTMQTGFSIGKSSLTTSITPRSRQLRPFTSADENAAMRGGAVQLQLTDRITALVYASRRQVDANQLYDDMDKVWAVSSYQRSGLHRTASEIEDRDALSQSILGGSVRYANSRGHVAINGSSLTQSLPIRRPDRLYNRYRFAGDQLYNVSADFSQYVSSIHLSGEIAHSLGSGWAKALTAVTSVDPKLDLALLYRDFDRDYHSIKGVTYAERDGVANEKGLYIGAEYRANARWTLSAYADHWRHDWLRFNVDAPTQGSGYLLKLLYGKRKKRDIYIQLRHKITQEEGDELRTYDYITDRNTYKARLHWSEIINKSIAWRARVELSRSTIEDKTATGKAGYVEGIWAPQGSGLSLSGRLMYFDVEDSYTRIYAYERDLQYEYSIPGFGGRGWRYYALAKYKLSRQLRAELKISNTQYTDDRESVGSGNIQTAGSHRTDVKVQLRYRF